MTFASDPNCFEKEEFWRKLSQLAAFGLWKQLQDVLTQCQHNRCSAGRHNDPLVEKMQDFFDNAVWPFKDSHGHDGTPHDYGATLRQLRQQATTLRDGFFPRHPGKCLLDVFCCTESDFNREDTDPFLKAITLLEKETEPTMLVIPDVIEMEEDDAYSTQMQMINHCGKMMNRVAILDIPGGFSEPAVGDTSVVKFRNAVTPLDPKFNSYATAYYPWLHTTVYQTSEISGENLSSADSTFTPLIALITDEFTQYKRPTD